MKLTKEKLNIYVPYGLRMKIFDKRIEHQMVELCGIDFSTEMHCLIGRVVDDTLFQNDIIPIEMNIVKPVLKELSKDNLDNFLSGRDDVNKTFRLEHKSLYSFKESDITLLNDFIKNNCLESLFPYRTYLLLVQNHFDMFGWINHGIAIDHNTL